MKMPTLLAAALLILPAMAEDKENPACDLLLESELAEAFGVVAREMVMNAEMTGSSDCSWSGGDPGHPNGSLALSRSRDMAFQGKSTATDAYNSWRDNFASGGKREDLTGIGEAAFIFTPKGSKAGSGLIVGVLVQGNVLLLGNSSLSRGVLLDLAARAARRV